MSGMLSDSRNKMAPVLSVHGYELVIDEVIFNLRSVPFTKPLDSDSIIILAYSYLLLLFL